jgi:hypothetical protein
VAEAPQLFDAIWSYCMYIFFSFYSSVSAAYLGFVYNLENSSLLHILKLLAKG